MKDSINILSVGSTLLFCLNIILLLTLKKERKDFQNLNQSLHMTYDSLGKLKNRDDVLLLNASLMFEFQSYKIDENVEIYDENEERITLIQLIQKKPKLIFKYSDLNCNVCIDEQINLLKKASEIIGSENIIILANYDSPRDLIQFRRMNQIDFKVLNLRDIEFTAVDKSLPYYFILDESLSLKLLYIPIKGDISLTQQYFEKINKRYFQ